MDTSAFGLILHHRNRAHGSGLSATRRTVHLLKIALVFHIACALGRISYENLRTATWAVFCASRAWDEILTAYCAWFRFVVYLPYVAIASFIRALQRLTLSSVKRLLTFTAHSWQYFDWLEFGMNSAPHSTQDFGLNFLMFELPFKNIIYYSLRSPHQVTLDPLCHHGLRWVIFVNNFALRYGTLALLI